jgi:hypothetical protein
MSHAQSRRPNASERSIACAIERHGCAPRRPQACHSGRLEVRLWARKQARRDFDRCVQWAFQSMYAYAGRLVGSEVSACRAKVVGYSVSISLPKTDTPTHPVFAPCSSPNDAKTLQRAACSVQRRSGGASGPLVDNRPSYSGAAQMLVACLSLPSAGARFACCAINSLEAIPVRPATPFPYLGPLASRVRVGRRVYLIHIPPLLLALLRFGYVCLLIPSFIVKFCLYRCATALV